MLVDVGAPLQLPPEQRRRRLELCAAALTGALVAALLFVAWDPGFTRDDYRLGMAFRDATVESKAARAPLMRECKSMAKAVYGYPLRPQGLDIRKAGTPESARAFYEGCRGEGLGDRIWSGD